MTALEFSLARNSLISDPLAIRAEVARSTFTKFWVPLLFFDFVIGFCGAFFFALDFSVDIDFRDAARLPDVGFVSAAWGFNCGLTARLVAV